MIELSNGRKSTQASHTLLEDFYKMRRSPLFSGIIYIIFGAFFIYFAVHDLQRNQEWGFYTYLLVILATFDIGSGIKLINFHFFLKKKQRDTKKPKQ